MGRKISLFVVCLVGVMLIVAPAAMAVTVTSIAPSGGTAGTTVQCTITGTFLLSGLFVDPPGFALNDGVDPLIPGTIVGPYTATSATVSFALPAAAPAVWYDLEARQTAFFITGTDTLADAFAILPTISALTPNSATAGAGELTLVVTGTKFVPSTLFFQGSSVRWDGAAVATTYNSATQLTAVIPAARLAAAGTAQVTVMNVTAGTTSAPATFTISALAPALTTISPTQVWAGYVKNDVVLTVNGSNFVTGAHIFLSGGEKTATTFVNATQLTVPLVASDMAMPGSLTVSVKNPPFPPGTSSAGALPLIIAAETTVPTVTITGADSAWHNAPVALSFSATDSQSGVQKVQYQSPPMVTAWVDGATYTVPVTTQGAIPVNAQALDWCNKAGTASATVYIDITKPETTALSSVTVKKGKTAKLKYKIGEPADLSPTANVVIKIKRGNGTTAKTVKIDGAPMNVEQTYSFRCNLAKGSYKWYVYATDLAGNTQDNIAKASLKVK